MIGFQLSFISLTLRLILLDADLITLQTSTDNYNIILFKKDKSQHSTALYTARRPVVTAVKTPIH